MLVYPPYFQSLPVTFCLSVSCVGRHENNELWQNRDLMVDGRNPGDMLGSALTVATNPGSAKLSSLSGNYLPCSVILSMLVKLSMYYSVLMF